MQIAVASGKGGTGKTTVSIALASLIAGKGIPVTILDCDVEEPNVNLFLKVPVINEEKIHSLIPEVNNEICNGCGKCVDICAFNCIVLAKGKPMIFADMCHSCGGCSLVCPVDAVSEVKKEIGIVEEGKQGRIFYAGGRLKIGEIMSPPLIKEVKKRSENSALTIIDCPPGTSCPVIESVSDSDYVILVTEPELKRRYASKLFPPVYILPARSIAVFEDHPEI